MMPARRPQRSQPPRPMVKCTNAIRGDVRVVVACHSFKEQGINRRLPNVDRPWGAYCLLARSLCRTSCERCLMLPVLLLRLGWSLPVETSFSLPTSALPSVLLLCCCFSCAEFKFLFPRVLPATGDASGIFEMFGPESGAPSGPPSPFSPVLAFVSSL